MNKKQWDSILKLAFLVHVVDVQGPKAFDVDVPSKLWEGV